MTSGFSLDTNSVWLPLQSFFLLTVNLDPNDWLSEYANSLKQQAFVNMYIQMSENWFKQCISNTEQQQPRSLLLSTVNINMMHQFWINLLRLRLFIVPSREPSGSPRL